MKHARYNGQLLPDDCWFERRPDPDDGYIAVDVDIEERCSSCSGTGLCVCDECGHEHDCGTCDGTGRAARGDVVYVKQEDIESIDRQNHIKAMLEKRYGSNVPESVADWWKSA
jgi:hypothetical protein